jgi:hypothetical protein
MATLEIMDVPDDVLRMLNSRAAESGQSLSEYVLGLLTRDVQRPTIEELTRRVESRGRVEIGTAAADILPEERDAR